MSRALRAAEAMQRVGMDLARLLAGACGGLALVAVCVGAAT